MFNSILLALSVSVDSFGIGITYGIKNTKFYLSSKCILFILSILVTSCSLIVGNFISLVLSELITKIISSSVLIIIGTIILIDPLPFDFDNSKFIDIKEAFALGISLSLDSFCIGIGSTIGGYSNILFPLLASSFQLLFINIGIKFGNKLIKKSSLSDKIWNIVSGIFIILFGILKFLI